MTILGPLLIAGIMVVPIWLSMQKPDKQKIEVIDESYVFTGLIPEKAFIHFDYPEVKFDQALAGFYDTEYDAILYVPHNILEGGNTVKLFYKKQLGIATEEYVGNTLSKMMNDVLLTKNNVDLNLIKEVAEHSKFTVLTEELEVTGKSKKTNTGLYMGIGLGAGFLIYMFIFLYGVQVMRGVMEEKTSRIVEVILSSVKPFQLMMGKIVGVALVGLTQFLLWVILTTTLYTIAAATILTTVDMKQIQQKETTIKIGADLNYMNMKKIQEPNMVTQVWNDFKSVDVLSLTLCFLFYFLVGYLMYAALFAAVGSAVDHESDTQQFMLPITIPLVFSFIIVQNVIRDPQGSMAFWFSMIPLSSPIVMMVRLPFGVPAWEIVLSMSFLVIGFVITSWLAARIYQTGILMYGKKVTWKELAKWLFYKM